MRKLSLEPPVEIIATPLLLWFGCPSKTRVALLLLRIVRLVDSHDGLNVLERGWCSSNRGWQGEPPARGGTGGGRFHLNAGCMTRHSGAAADTGGHL